MTSAPAQTPYTGMQPTLSDALQRMIAASHGRITIESGFRDDATQSRLFDAAVKKYGSVSAARNWVAPPGQSNHNKGLAADLGGDIALAHQLAPQFGLVFPMGWEPWHIEPVGARETASPQAYTTAPSGEANPTDPSTWNTLPSVLAMVSNALATPDEGVLAGEMPAATSSSTGAATSTPGSTPGNQSGAMTDQGAVGPQVFGQGTMQSTPDRVQWANDFLTALGKPVTQANLQAIVAWQQAESGGGGGAFNPLNTTQGGYPGETDLNSVGVKNYTNYADGIAANVKVINNGRYQPILDALSAGTDPTAVARAVAATPWGTGNGVLQVLGTNPPPVDLPKPSAPAAAAPKRAAPAAPAQAAGRRKNL